MQWDVPGVLVSRSLAGPASCSMGLGTQVSQRQGSWPGTWQPPRELGLGPCSPRPWGVTRAAGSSPWAPLLRGLASARLALRQTTQGGLGFSGTC